MQSPTRLLLVLTLAAGVAACGSWQLRGAQGASGALPDIQVVSDDDAYSPMARSVRDVIDRQQQSATQNTLYRLHIIEETIDRRPVTFTATGTPAQYEMTLSLTYSIETPNQEGLMLPRQTYAHRLYDFDPRNVVAKSEEERALLEQMRQQVAQRLVSEISRRYNNVSTAEDKAADPQYNQQQSD